MKLPVLTPWYADGLQFTCTACGDCCTGGHGFVWITPEEIRRMADHLKLTTRTFIKRHCRKVDGKYSLNEVENRPNEFDCTFLVNHQTGRGGCSIYPVRPTQCRTWPFWPENLTNQKAWNQAAKGCKGMNVGTAYPVERIESLRDAEDWPDNPPTSRKRR